MSSDECFPTASICNYNLSTKMYSLDLSVFSNYIQMFHFIIPHVLEQFFLNQLKFNTFAPHLISTHMSAYYFNKLK
jgi:hypothetical protein